MTANAFSPGGDADLLVEDVEDLDRHESDVRDLDAVAAPASSEVLVPHLLSVFDVAQRLRVCTRTVWNLLRSDRRFPRRRRVGRRTMFLAADVDLYIAGLGDDGGGVT